MQTLIKGNAVFLIFMTESAISAGYLFFYCLNMNNAAILLLLFIDFCPIFCYPILNRSKKRENHVC